MTTSKTSSNAPVAELRDGLMKIAIFRNEPKEEGDRVRFSGKLTRSYQDAAGDWHDSAYLSSVDYLKAANLMVEAYNTEREPKQAEKDAVPENVGPA